MNTTEQPPRIGPWLVPASLAILSTYVLLVALALADLPTARWGYWIAPAAPALFAVAVILGLRGLPRD